jgi:hypothetical protein
MEEEDSGRGGEAPCTRMERGNGGSVYERGEEVEVVLIRGRSREVEA